MISELYALMGATFMAKLKGTFAFCLYCADSGRVLVANDAAGDHNLYQAHLKEDHSLLVSCNVEVPAQDLVPESRVVITGGRYKFGWRAGPQTYMCDQETTAQKQRDATRATMAALMVRFDWCTSCAQLAVLSALMVRTALSIMCLAVC